MVKILELWSTYQKHGQHTRNKKESGAQSIHELGAVGSLAARPGNFGLVEEIARTRVKN